MSNKAFTLIELLVVVAIIGILAAVGVVAYNGYTNSAKSSVIKSNHKLVVQKVLLLINECEINSSANMMSAKNSQNINSLACYGNPFWFFGEYLKNDFDNRLKWTNPLNLTSMGSSNMGTMQVGSCYGATQDNYQGFVWVRSKTASTPSDKNVEICTCFKSPCNNSSNRLEIEIPFN
jgi:prepilin-type N-terminal cleavage/methylation domain-containing protein